MKFYSKKFLLMATAMAVSLPVTAVVAATTNFDALASFASALTLDTEVPMDFANWYYGHAPGAGDTIALGTDASVTPSANFSTNGGVPVAGSVSVHGVAAFPIEVTCSATATLAEAGGGTIDAVEIEVTDTAGGAAFGTGDACDPVTPVVYNLVAGEAVLKFGGKLDGATAAGFVTGAYSTATLGGSDIQVDVVYQ
ncbi:MAG: DUF4402 domain-containing protein [Pseudomonadota bacterium]